MDQVRLAVGVDPGFANTGIAVVKLEDDGRARCLAVRFLHTPADKKAKQHGLRTDADDLRRFGLIFDATARAIDRSGAKVVGLETYKIAGARGAPGLARQAGGNAWKVSTSYGVCVGAALSRGCKVFAHSPAELKVISCGRVAASKEDVMRGLAARCLDVHETVERHFEQLRAERKVAAKSKYEHCYDAIGHALLALKTANELTAMMG